MAIQACVLAGRPEVLWGDVFPRFQAYEAADAFLAQLQPAILADEVPSPAPEVVQVRFGFCHLVFCLVACCCSLKSMCPRRLQ